MRKIALVLVALFIPAVVGAADPVEVDPVVSYRKALMSSTGAHMSGARLVIKGQVDRPGDMVMHAKSLHDASKVLCELFPKSTTPKEEPTIEALLAVWTKPEEFKKACETFELETSKLFELSRGSDFDAVKGQYKAVGQSCGGCHDTFKKDEDH